MADDQDLNQEEQQDELSAEELQEAREMGWSPKEKWRGKEEDWVDAKTFLERGRNVLPIVTAQNRDLRNSVRTQSEQLTTLARELQATKAALDAIQEENTEDAEKELKDTKDRLETEIEAASRDGDHKQVAKLTRQLAELSAVPPREPREPRRDTPPAGPYDAEIARWFDDNPDYRGRTRKSALAVAVSEEVKRERPELKGAAFLDEVATRTEEALEGRSERPSRVNGGNGGTSRRSGGGGSGGEKTFADLPKDAQQACDGFAKRVVGEGKKHKDLASWRKAYTASYFRGEQR